MIAFPFHEYWLFYVGFVFFIGIILSLDLGLFHRKTHKVTIKEASVWTCIWISLALLFNLLFYLYARDRFIDLQLDQPITLAKQKALEFLAGFIIEKSLAIDNLFIFAVVFSYFKIPDQYQHRILFWGVVGALIFRALFIALGSLLMQYHWVLAVFGILLIITGVKMIVTSENEHKLESNWLIIKIQKWFRVSSKDYGDQFFVRINGKSFMTPLFLCLVFIEMTDIIFAIDSVPAIFALTNEPLIVFTSNIFAILGLRSMYFLLNGVIGKFKFIKYGLAAVLIFVGLKMSYLNKIFEGGFPIGWSLTIIISVVASSILFSILHDSIKKRIV